MRRSCGWRRGRPSGGGRRGAFGGGAGGCGVGAGGDVVGVDRDEAILRLAKREAERRGLSVAFRRLGVEDLNEESAYDLVISRYLLSHLPRPRRSSAAR